MMMIIMILIHVITILHYLLITKNNSFHVFEKKTTTKKKNNITLCKHSLVVCARTNFSEGIPSLITLTMIMIIKSLIIYNLLIHAAICM